MQNPVYEQTLASSFQISVRWVMERDAEMEAIYAEVSRVIGRAVIVLKSSKRIVSPQMIDYVLQEYEDQEKDKRMLKVYAIARKIMREP